MRKILTTEGFIEKAIKIHGSKYDYSKVKYISGDGYVIIMCKIHKEFKQKAVNHLSGKGCWLCGINKRAHSRALTKEEFIKKSSKIHNEKYLYNKIDYYKNNNTEVNIVCKDHGSFFQKAGVHLRGHGCPQCSSDRNLKTTEEFIENAIKIHGYMYDYSKVDYKNGNKKVIIHCKKHKDFKQTPNCHLSGCGCPHCFFKSEGLVKNFIYKYFSDWKIISNKKIWDSYKDYNHRRYCDFWIEKDNIKIIVEYDGEHHFRPVSFGCKDGEKVLKMFNDIQSKDRLDTEFCCENDIILHRIRYDEDKELSIINLKNRIDNLV